MCWCGIGVCIDGVGEGVCMSVVVGSLCIWDDVE